MDSEIKRLLKLSSIPGFQLSKKELKTLDEWKKAQKSVKPKRTRKTRAPKGYKVMDGMGVGTKPTIVSEDSLHDAIEETPKKVTNQVKPEEKEIGEIEES